MFVVAIYARCAGDFIIYDPGKGIVHAETGYAGSGEHKNRPESDGLKDKGPLPSGTYAIGPASDHPRLGPLAHRLVPHPTTRLKGRSGFMIHGDSRKHPGQASRGCVVISRAGRAKLSSLGVRVLEVV
jgi:hypothetical protein